MGLRRKRGSALLQSKLALTAIGTSACFCDRAGAQGSKTQDDQESGRTTSQTWWCCWCGPDAVAIMWTSFACNGPRAEAALVLADRGRLVPLSRISVFCHRNLPVHSTSSTGRFRRAHWMVANGRWDREHQKMVTCTIDPNAKNAAYSGGSTTKGGDSSRSAVVFIPFCQLPAFSLGVLKKFQTGGAARVVSFPIKARGGRTPMAGPQGLPSATWIYPPGTLVTSTVFETMPFWRVRKEKSRARIMGMTWSLLLPANRCYRSMNCRWSESLGRVVEVSPFPARAKTASAEPERSLLRTSATSPFADPI